ncbi:MAG: phenylalanine--tRNA ligase subunit beta, partial [Deltaproteobacteria bacterium]|nr:phenylalanine--tRNA ligase subunit beta [Deltaproteobacteria bacterium]
ASLIAELSGGQVLDGVIDTYPRKLEPLVIELQHQKVVDLLDVPVDSETIRTLLESIGLEVRAGSSVESLAVTIPSFRPDIEREVDLIEEVARLYGYERIPVTMPVGTVDAVLPPKRQKLQQQLRQLMVKTGFSEAMNYSFIAPDAVGKMGLDSNDERLSAIRIMNPLSEDQAVMRTTHVPSLLETVVRNINYRSFDLRLFELRPVFLTQAEHDACQETLTLTAVMSGRRAPEGWCQSTAAVDFYDLKAVVEEITEQTRLADISFDAGHSQNYFHPGKSCCVKAGEQIVGYLGELHPQVLAQFSIDQPVYLFELDVEKLILLAGSCAKFQPLSRFPDVIRDSALLLDDEIQAAQILEIVKRSKLKSVDNVTLFDLYTGQGIPAGKKSLAIRVRYRDLEKTLTEEEVSKSHDKLIRSLSQQLGAEIR